MSENDLETMIVGDILGRWPATITIFNRHKMACPGCAMAPFMTLTEACRAYGVDAGLVAARLRKAIDEAAAATGRTRA